MRKVLKDHCEDYVVDDPFESVSCCHGCTLEDFRPCLCTTPDILNDDEVELRYNKLMESKTDDLISSVDIDIKDLLEKALKISESDEDIINHPNHYTDGGMECIDEMLLVFGKRVVADFCLCNVWKYRYRALGKNGEEDLKKADWYMVKYKELVTEMDGELDEWGYK